MDNKTGGGAFEWADRAKVLRDGVVIKALPPQAMKVIVKDEGGVPVEGTEVRVSAMHGSSYGVPETAKTNSSGETVFDKVYVGGSYALSASLKGYYDYGSRPSPNVGSDEWKDVQEIVLKRADIAKGRVVDVNGDAVGGARLLVVNEERRTHGADATADPNGYFELNIPGEEELTYTQTPSGRVRGMVQLKIEGGGRGLAAILAMRREDLLSEGLVLTAKPLLTLTVVVKDTEGRPLNGVEVVPTLWHGGSGESCEWPVSDADGEAVCRKIHAGGEYAVNTTLDGYYRSSRDHLPVAGSPDWKDRVELVMERADRTQTGTVVDDDGNPVTWATVRAYVGDEITATTDAEGRFELKGLPGSEMCIRDRPSVTLMRISESGRPLSSNRPSASVVAVISSPT